MSDEPAPPAPPTPPPSSPAGAPAPGTARKRRPRWRRRLLVSIAALVLLVFLAPLAAGLAPVRRWVAARLSEEVGRRVTIGGLSAWWWSGIEIRTLEVHDPEDFAGEPLLFVERTKVRVALFSLLGGTLDATALVERPVVTVKEAADGRRNTDGLLEGGDRRRAKREKGADDGDGAKPRGPRGRRGTGGDLALTVTGGRVVSHGPPGAGRGSPETVDAIALELRLRPGGSVRVDFHATAPEAAPGGGPAEIDVRADLDDDGSGTVKADLPPVDLARLRRILGPPLGLSDLAGTLAAHADFDLDPRGNPSGTARLTLAGLRARTARGSVEWKSLVLDANPAVEPGGTRFPVDLVIEGLVARGFSERDAGIEEPRLRLSGVLVRSDRGDVSFGEAGKPLLLEGRTLSGSVSGALTGLDGESAAADVRARLSLALSPSLGRVAGILSAPDDDLRGVATLDASVTGSGGALAIRCDGTLRDLVVGGAGGSQPWKEPNVTLAVAAAWDAATRTLTVSRGVLSSGAVTVTAKDPLVVVVPKEDGAPVAARGEATVSADFVRLARVRSFVPEFRSVRSGSLAATVTFDVARATKVGFAVRVVDLGFLPGEWSSAGYVERDLTAQGAYERPERGDASLTLVSLRSAIASLAEGRGPVTVRLGDGTFGIEGKAALAVDLAAARGAFDRAMGLAPGDALSGRLLLTVAGSGDAKGSAFEAAVEGRDLLLPGADEAEPGRLDGRGKVRSDAATGTVIVESADLSGYGLRLSGSAVIARQGGSADVRTARLAADGDLAAARPLLALLGAVERDAVLEGTLEAKADVAAADPGRTVVGRAVVRRLRFAAGPRKAVLEEASVTVEHDLLLDSPAGTHRIRRLSLSSGALSASASGTATRRGESYDLDAKVDVDGDAKTLAAHLRAVLGEGYDDLDGEGRLAGRFSAAGPLGDDLRGLRVDGEASFVRFHSGGLSLSDGTLTAKRAAGEAPLALTIASGVNGGTLRVDATVDLAPGDAPWTAKVAARGIDTGPLVTAKGASRYLPMVLPALVPAGSKTPVLSGKLDADVDLRSPSLRDPAMTDGLTGKGTLAMGQGALTESTLFAAIAGKGKGGQGLAALGKLVPDLGRELEALGRSVVFSEMSSRFTVGERHVRLQEVKLTAERASLAFSGVVGFDGRCDLRVPLRLGGEVGKAIRPYVKDSTIPLRVRGDVESPRVEPDLKLENVGKGLLEDLLKGRR